jgi:hypothetical protein
MSTLVSSILEIPGASLGPDNPFPQLVPSAAVPPVLVHENVPEDLRRHIGYGVGAGVGAPCLPYLLQDGYDRGRNLLHLPALVLENEILRATVFPSLGGRLQSLFHKPSGRELLEVNPVFQPGNLAVRNAWFSGGIEWNCGVRGHTPLTCSPMFAGRVMHPDGWPVLRLWEFERIREVPYQIDFVLPPGSPWLFVRAGICNPHKATVPMYWWSNIAVPERDDVRVVAPAAEAMTYGYQGSLRMIPVPDFDGIDRSYATRVQYSSDFFYHVPDATRPWIAALDGSGMGLVQTSTSRLRGRKLFVWGHSQGGRQWQKFLTEGERRYLEIQAGVARTQYESFPLAAGERITWTEAYGLMEAETSRVHGAEWAEAVAEVGGNLNQGLSAQELEEMHQSLSGIFDRPPEEILHSGAGWGALENLRRQAAGEPPMALPGAPFGASSLTADQAPWLELLEKGSFPECLDPGSWMVSSSWENLLTAGSDRHWVARLHLGLMAFHRGNADAARSEWELSLGSHRSVWALRNLGQLALQRGEFETAIGLLAEARAIRLELVPLQVEYFQALLAGGRAAEVVAEFGRLPAALAAVGRLRLLCAEAALSENRLDLAESLLGEDLVVPDLQEGEKILSELWYDLLARREALACGGEVTDEIRNRVRQSLPPPHLDFRQVGFSQPPHDAP